MPILEPCMYCGQAAAMYAGAVECSNGFCRATGPANDPDGARWNEVARKARMYDESLIGKCEPKQEAGNDAPRVH